jgi:hypothetical protein
MSKCQRSIAQYCVAANDAQVTSSLFSRIVDVLLENFASYAIRNSQRTNKIMCFYQSEYYREYAPHRFKRITKVTYAILPSLFVTEAPIVTRRVRLGHGNMATGQDFYVYGEEYSHGLYGGNISRRNNQELL